MTGAEAEILPLHLLVGEVTCKGPLDKAGRGDPFFLCLTLSSHGTRVPEGPASSWGLLDLEWPKSTGTPLAGRVLALAFSVCDPEL